MLPAVRAILLSGLDPDALAWSSAVVAAGANVSGTQLNNVSTLIRGLKADGVWSSLDRLWLFAAENSTQARRDLVARAVATPQNSPTFTANRGYAGDALSAYIDTGFNPASGSPHYARDSANFGAWQYLAPTAVGGCGYLGTDSVNNGVYFNTGSNVPAGVNTNTGSPMISALPGAASYLVEAERTASTAQAIYQNAVSVATKNDASVAVVSRNFFALAVNSGSGAVLFSDGGISAAFIGSSLSASQRAARYRVLRTYMTAVGIP
jgi:hypothetical protein